MDVIERHSTFSIVEDGIFTDESLLGSRTSWPKCLSFRTFFLHQFYLQGSGIKMKSKRHYSEGKGEGTLMCMNIKARSVCAHH